MITWDGKKEINKDRHLRQWKNEKWVASGGIWIHETALWTDALTNWSTKACTLRFQGRGKCAPLDKWNRIIR